ncbi:ATP-binding protein [Actinomadura sp. NPDC047616]|uniref:ATP-binding protein n=1 Tax=Actinomadura sp. NPDC047616 TaxID=3155914 RepID=UPI0033FE04E6
MWRAVRDLAAGEVAAWALPGDRTCAGFARSAVGDLLGGLRIPLEIVRDAQTMVSEAATNAYEHAHIPHGTTGGWELWAFRAGRGVVCGVFDPVPDKPLPARPVRPDPLLEHGRGLAILHELSRGAWGVHRTRGQLGGHVPGKVVWFRCPVTVDLPVLVPRDEVEMARAVRDRLRARGVEGTILASCSRMACVSVCRGLDVWCRDGRFFVREAARSIVWAGEERAVVVEHAVRRYEETRCLPGRS